MALIIYAMTKARWMSLAKSWLSS